MLRLCDLWPRVLLPLHEQVKWVKLEVYLPLWTLYLPELSVLSVCVWTVSLHRVPLGRSVEQNNNNTEFKQNRLHTLQWGTAVSREQEGWCCSDVSLCDMNYVMLCSGAVVVMVTRRSRLRSTPPDPRGSLSSPVSPADHGSSPGNKETKRHLIFLMSPHLILICHDASVRTLCYLDGAGQRVGVAFHQLLASDGLRVCGASYLHDTNRDDWAFHLHLQKSNQTNVLTWRWFILQINLICEQFEL